MSSIAGIRSRLRMVWETYPPEHLFQLMTIHLENSTLEERSVKNGKVFERVFDDWVDILVEESKEDDIKIRDINFKNNKILPYLPIEEILSIFEKGLVEKEITAELNSPLKIKGNQEILRYHIFSKKSKLYLKTKIKVYDESIAQNSRNLFALKFVNKEIIEDEIYYICKLLSLVFTVHFDFQITSNLEPPKKIAELKKIEFKYNSFSTRFFHDKEQDLDIGLFTQLIDGYSRLGNGNLMRLKRALYWVEKAIDQRESDYLLHIAIMIETLSPKNSTGKCWWCKEVKYTTGMTKLYRDFICKYSGLNESLAKKYANRMYDARSRIVHDGKLLPGEDPAMKFRNKFFLFNMSAPRWQVAKWISNWIQDQLD